MPTILDWVRRTTSRVFDPAQEERIDHLAKELEMKLKREREAFDLLASAEAWGAKKRDVPLVADRIYERALERVWRDLTISAKERAGLIYVAQRLGIDEARRRELERVAGLAVFERYLATCMSDGVIDHKEAKMLEGIAQSLGTNPRGLMKSYFAKEGEGFLRGVFASFVERGSIGSDQLKLLTDAAKAFGFSEGELQEIIRPQVERCLEHVMADAKSDEYLSEEEHESIRWMLSNYALSSQFQRYIEGEVADLAQISRIRDGQLPTIVVDNLSLRAGEIVHLQSFVRYEKIRHLKSGVRVDTHDGIGLITETRFMFSSETKSFDVNHRRVLDIIPLSRGFQLRTGGKGSGNYDFGSNNRLAIRIYEVAVGKANQTIVERQDGLPSRHIPREVRQRVWQKYGGACAECQANQYLEFDHIIPVAKGGSNSETNVQLLCRRCNLKKSDRI